MEEEFNEENAPDSVWHSVEGEEEEDPDANIWTYSSDGNVTAVLDILRCIPEAINAQDENGYSPL